MAPISATAPARAADRSSRLYVSSLQPVTGHRLPDGSIGASLPEQVRPRRIDSKEQYSQYTTVLAGPGRFACALTSLRLLTRDRMDKNGNAYGLAQRTTDTIASEDGIVIPEYLSRHYWWAYIHPWAVAFFDHVWIVNLILLGNYKRLRDRALDVFGPAQSGKVLQVACVYGDITARLAASVYQGGGALDVVDVVPIVPTRAIGRKPALRSSEIASSSASTRNSNRSLVGILASPALPSPSVMHAFSIDEWASDDA